MPIGCLALIIRSYYYQAYLDRGVLQIFPSNGSLSLRDDLFNIRSLIFGASEEAGHTIC